MNKKLKTLKDIEGNIGNALYFFRGEEEPTNEWDGKVAFSDELRQEAIKWVNHFLKYGSELRDFTVWRLFFNITEEDLI